MTTTELTLTPQQQILWSLDTVRERAAQVLDSLHHRDEVEPTAAIFIAPGLPDHDVTPPIASYSPLEAQRSLEYDQLTPRYGEFLFTEMLPLLEQKLSLKVSSDPTRRTVCGISSGHC